MSESLLLGALLAVAGGFFDAYTYLCRGGVFANAQTGNIVLFEMCIRDSLEAADGFRNRHILALEARELLRNVEWLRQEVLYLAGAGNGQLILVGKLIHAEDGNNILQILVFLQD